MRKNTFLAKTLSIVLIAMVLSAIITAVVFNYSGGWAFSRIKAGELEPRAKFIADVTAEYLAGDMSREAYRRAIGSGYRIWDAALYIFDANGELFAYPSRSDNTDNIAATQQHLKTVLSGETLVSPSTSNSISLIVGEPVKNDTGEVIAAVFFVKPLHELNAAIRSLLIALLVSMVLSTAIMLIPAYFGSKNMTEPIRQMNATANAMANGDFSAKASESGSEELAQLGRSLNHLSSALYATISDLTLEKNRLHAVINGLGEGIIAINGYGELIKLNRSAYTLLGGREDGDITELPAYKECSKDVEKVLSGEAHAERLLAVRDKKLAVTVTALRDEDRMEGAVMLIRDVTEAERLEQTRRDYVANVSHELRTPLSSIRSLADALNDGLIKKDADRARYYGYILHESMRLSRLIDDLMELSRLQSGTLALTKQHADILEIAQDVAQRFSAAAKERGMTISVDIPKGCERAFTNPDRAEQAMVTLIDNAIKYGDPSGGIAIRARDAGASIRLTVENSGSIADADIDHVFERFYKADKAHTGSGTGLGLSIVSEVMAQMGEKVWVTSENGLVTFGFTLSRSAHE